MHIGVLFYAYELKKKINNALCKVTAHTLIVIKINLFM